ncbi:MAG: hypothetical protein MUP27_08975 [Desulfobacterales bacterium]|nr:hypothetical protein [Desulfobacterales bacterium]
MIFDPEDKIRIILLMRKDLGRQILEEKIRDLAQTTTTSWDDWVDICYRRALGDRLMLWEMKK